MAKAKKPDQAASGIARDPKRATSSTRASNDGRSMDGTPSRRPDPLRKDDVVFGKYRDHAWLRDRYFYSLPRSLWNHVVKELGENAFDADALAMELELSNLCGDHSATVGFLRGRRISYGFLRRSEIRRPSLKEVQELGWDIDVSKLKQNLDTLEERSNRFFQPLQAYAGWLMSEPTFLNEHDVFFESWSSFVANGALNQSPFALNGGTLGENHDAQSPFADSSSADPEWTGFLSDYEAFCRRWRLTGLAGPWLPIPRGPLLLGEMPASIVQQLVREGGLFWIPDTIPVPSRDELRRILDDALHGGEQPTHLTPWKEIIASDNAARKELARFRRVFEVQHYWRILKTRHADSLLRREGKFKQALASFLDVSVDCIHRDLLFLKARLGDDWTSRLSAFSAGGV
ncbi:MAG: hypothetical protein U1A77_24745 [Pirellulales bacterium]